MIVCTVVCLTFSFSHNRLLFGFHRGCHCCHSVRPTRLQYINSRILHLLSHVKHHDFFVLGQFVDAIAVAKGFHRPKDGVGVIVGGDRLEEGGCCG